jgi:hypothetical protein
MLLLTSSRPHIMLLAFGLATLFAMATTKSAGAHPHGFDTHHIHVEMDMEALGVREFPGVGAGVVVPRQSTQNLQVGLWPFS